MALRVVVLGAGFAGLELSSRLSETLGDRLELTLIDKSEDFLFGFSKLEVLFGRRSTASVRLPYREIAKPGVRFVRTEITRIEPERRRVTTADGSYDADVLVVALGADYDIGATPGLAEGGYEFYSVEGAERAREALARFPGGKVVIGVASLPFKCPPAPSETALLLDEYLRSRGLRESSEITLAFPFGAPIPPSPVTSKALLEAFRDRGILFLGGSGVARLETDRKRAVLTDGRQVPYDLFLGVPRHCAPKVVVESGLCEDGWVAVDPHTLSTRFPGVYACGDVAETEVPKAGVFAEGGAKVIAEAVIATAEGRTSPSRYAGKASCYVEFGGGKVGRTDMDFFSGPQPVGTFVGASTELAQEKERFGTSRAARWFGR